MILSILAQTTIPSNPVTGGGLDTATKTILAVLGSVILILGLISTTLIPLLFQLFRNFKTQLQDLRRDATVAKEKAVEAEKKAAVAETKADASQKTVDTNSERITTVARQVGDVQKATIKLAAKSPSTDLSGDTMAGNPGIGEDKPT